MGGREFLAAGLRLDGIVEDAEVEVEAGRPVALLDQHLPQRQRVLASRHRHQHGLLGREHPVLADRLADLIAEELDEVRLAEGGVVPPELDDRPTAALPAFQEASPIISPLASPAAGCGCARPSPIISPLASPAAGCGCARPSPIISPLASPAAGCGCARPSPIISPLASPRGTPRLALPPLITGRSSIVSSSVTIWSAVTRVSPRITSTVSGMISSSRRTSFTLRPPATWTSRFGFLRMTFMGASGARSARFVGGLA